MVRRGVDTLLADLGLAGVMLDMADPYRRIVTIQLSSADLLGVVEAIIKALREPTPYMIRAACKALSPGRRPTPERVSVREKHVIRWKMMIDAALKP